MVVIRKYYYNGLIVLNSNALCDFYCIGSRMFWCGTLSLLGHKCLGPGKGQHGHGPMKHGYFTGVMYPISGYASDTPWILIPAVLSNLDRYMY
jgi:hypothetical protein